MPQEVMEDRSRATPPLQGAPILFGESEPILENLVELVWEFVGAYEPPLPMTKSSAGDPG